MANIHPLDSALIDQIAAGEVIDRPASVLKELIENSLDSGANKIEIQISKGGHELIQVSDNGCGMNQDDLRLAFKRHATSKIQKLEDLNSIQTLGFRGEALPSIASVSMVNARSSEGDSNGFGIKINGSEEQYLKPVAGLPGTTIKVQNLFYNTPARRKFLKKPETEQAVINSIMRRFMLSRPDVGFKMNPSLAKTRKGRGLLRDRYQTPLVTPSPAGRWVLRPSASRSGQESEEALSHKGRFSPSNQSICESRGWDLL